ncbi:hypothetical protein XH96_28885 [Bradyrhizobium sp. CCBAU 51765]|nr:hypothetical protein XH96_28885 [Bradyrhizobium sp. CCBAU 51765]
MVSPEQAVPKYFAIDAGVRFDCDKSDLLTIKWEAYSLSADFLLPDANRQALRVRFNGATIVRLLDEMPLSTEQQPTKNEGLVPRHFAYRVEGSTFADTQSEPWKKVHHPVRHYEFITGWGCMDVLSGADPTFEVIDISD